MRFVIYSLRRTIITLTLALIIAGVLWWGLWTLAATEFRESIDGWIASGRAGGYAISYDGYQVFGFPHRVVLRLTNLNWKNTEGIAFHADQMDLSSLPWNKETFNAGFRGHVEVSAPLDADGKALTLGGENGRAHVVVNPDGLWTLSRVSLAEAELGRAPDVLSRAEKLEVTAERPDNPPQDHTKPSLTLTGHAENLTLPAGMPTPFGPAMTVLDVSLRVMGDTPDFRKKDSVAAWNTASGVVEFDNLRMEWGVLRMTAKGTLGFDDDLQPEGAFSSMIGNHNEVLDTLMKQDFIPQRQAGMLSAALNLFAKPSGEKADIEVPVTVQLGGLYLGPVRIFVFPMIEWPKG